DRLRGGSRFNIRYKDRVPPGVHVEDVSTALAEFVDFKGAAPAVVNLPPLEPARVRKGMLRADAEKTYGRPEKTSQKTLGEFTVVTLVFLSGEQRITADFVEACSYATRSRRSKPTDVELDDAYVRRHLTLMKTTVSSKGQIVLPA